MLAQRSKVVARALPIYQPLLEPHVCSVDEEIAPGLTSLTWSSLNVDVYLERVRQALEALSILITKCNDIIECRIANALTAIERIEILPLPQDPTTLTEFASNCETQAVQSGETMQIKNREVESAVHDLVDLLLGPLPPSKMIFVHPLIPAPVPLKKKDEEEKEDAAPTTPPPPPEPKRTDLKAEAKKLEDCYASALFQSLVKGITANLMALKNRFTEKVPPVFTLVVDLQAATESDPTNGVILRPALDDVRRILVNVSKIALSATQRVYSWGQLPYLEPPKPQQAMTASSSVMSLGGEDTLVQPGSGLPARDLDNFFGRVASNKEIIKVVLLLTGTLRAFRKQVKTHKERFQEFHKLWEESMEKETAEFVARNPKIDAYEAMIQSYEQTEERVKEFPDTTEISMFALNAAPVKQKLHELITRWKAQYSSSLRSGAHDAIAQLAEFIEDHCNRLSRPLADPDLAEIAAMVNTLREVREKECNLDLELIPAEEKYAFLNKYKVPVSEEERDLLDTIRYKWKKVKTQSVSVQDVLASIQGPNLAKLKTGIKEFQAEVVKYKREYDAVGPMVPAPPKQAMERLKAYKASFADMERKLKLYSDGEELFGLPKSAYADLAQIRSNLVFLDKLYSLYSDVINSVQRYKDTLWLEMDFEKISSQLGDYQVKCRALPKQMKDWEAYQELKKTVDDFYEILPTLQSLNQPSMRPRHWTQIMTICKSSWKLDGELKLGGLLDGHIIEHREEIEDITNACAKEADIEIKIKDIADAWADRELTFTNFKQRGELLLKASPDIEKLKLDLEDAQMALGSLMSNRFNAPFKDKITEWNNKLTLSYEIIDQWLTVQGQWIYLEAVFNGGDIATQLPQAARQFQTADKSWVKLMETAREKKNVVQVCYMDESLRTLLPHLAENLESCQKSLSGYLETKRGLFARFYFVSDPNLLEILGQASDPNAIQPQLKNIFDNIARIDFDKTHKSHVIAMNSSENEHIDFAKRVVAEGHIEHWLQLLVDEMRHTLMLVVKDSQVHEKDYNLEEFIWKYPAQVALLSLQIRWTRDCDLALRNVKTSKNALVECNKGNNNVLRQLIQMTTQELTQMNRTKLETLITIQVHQRDVFEELVRLRIKSPFEFDWLKQTRFYWKSDEEIVNIQITDIDFLYCYEYLGCTERLVITPLTDRCYITLAQAVGMYLGGAPAGPAGTGKTETVKDMGKALAKYVVVFNCSDQMDFRGLGKIFKGLAQSGSWGDFDEFNRIELQVLSVVAQQLACVFAALKERRTSFTFTDNTTVPLIPTVAYFITMNPGYAGRQELPENLKAIFRSVAMMVPDRQIIMRVKLAASGFQENQILAKKLFILYRLCEEQLSAQRHYDFGLRNILSVLRTSGSTKRSRPTENEAQILMRVVRDMNLSKLVDEDEPLFLSLIDDLFPGQTVEKEHYPELEKGIQEFCDQTGLINHPDWNLKLIQLYETWRVRHGIMVLGSPGSGKTQCIQILLKAFSRIGMPHKDVRMNPKAITANQMFGRLDVATNEWFDGIFATLWRKICRKESEWTWIILDGPVDALWIESLNTVLDDNKTLTLANSDRIRMSPRLKLVFEIANLDNASPATVSRAGMIYLSRSTLGWAPVVLSRLKGHPAAAALEQLYSAHTDRIFSFLAENCKPVMSNEQVCAACQSLNLLEGLLPSRESTEVLRKDHVERLFVFAMIWGLGALLERSDRLKLHNYLKDNLQLSMPEIATTAEGQADTVYEYMVDPKSGQWVPWSSLVPMYEYPKTHTPDFAGIFVPTVDNVRTDFLIQTLAAQRHSVLLIGESGTAKTVCALQHLGKQDNEKMLTKVLNFSSATTPMIFQRTLESLVDKRASQYGPPGGKRMTIFVDDINMPEYNEWNDQVTNEIVRQVLEYHMFYDVDKPGQWRDLVDLQYMAAMPHPGGGRNDIPPRLKRHFNIFNITMPLPASVRMIYGTIAEGHFCTERGFSPEVIQLAARLPAITQELWGATKQKMLPTPAKFHYMFNLRDLSRIFQGLIRAESDVIRNPKALLQLWRHECCRVLPDRFTSKTDVAWFDKSMEDQLIRTFGDQMAHEVMRPALWVDFLRDAPEADMTQAEDAKPADAPKIYEPAFDPKALGTRVESLQATYNEANRRQQISLVFFSDALAHLSRIYRIITTPRGNALLVGVGGSGKQTLTRLASYIAHSRTYQIQVSKNYTTTNLLDDLKNIYRIAGCEGKPVTFLFTDNEIKEEGFLEYINCILTSGEIPSLFPKDEVETIVSDLRPIMKKTRPRVPDTNLNLWSYFIDRVRDNLHVVLCFSPVGEKFRNRSRKFPGLISGCNIDWFSSWPSEALMSVAEHFLSDFKITCTPEVKRALVQHMAYVHDIVGQTCSDYFQRLRRYAYVTPKSYLSFIRSYMSMYTAKRDELLAMRERLQTGIEKLEKAGVDIEEMKKDLIKKEAELKIAQQSAAECLVEITANTTVAEKAKMEVQKVKDDLAAKAAVINAQKDDAERDLALAKPALEEAVAALNAITPGDISTVKKLGSPPLLIKVLMDGVLLLRKFRVDPVVFMAVDKHDPLMTPSWANAKLMMQDAGFLNALLDYKKEGITDEQCELLQPYLEMSDFNKEAAAKACGNMAGLASWVGSMVKYHNIAKDVDPKIRAVEEAERLLKATQAKLDVAEAALAEKQKHLDKMKAQYDDAMMTKQKLQDEADRTRRRMESANALITGLGGEKIRWTQSVAGFNKEIENLVGDVCFSTAFLSYAGNFNSEYRDKLKNLWLADLTTKRIPKRDELNIIKFCSDDATIAEWNVQGLPTDDLSVQNGIIVTSADRYPLLIDPQGQARFWIGQMEKAVAIKTATEKAASERAIAEKAVAEKPASERPAAKAAMEKAMGDRLAALVEQAPDLKVTTLGSRQFKANLEECLSQGRPLLIEDVGEELDPMLDSVLEKQFVKVGAKNWQVRVGDKDVDLDRGFRLYITTKLPNPHYSPEISARTAVIDFSVTMKGLEQQILGRVIQKERAELEEQRHNVLADVAKNKKKMQDLERLLLKSLSSSQKSLLDDDEVILTLQQTKKTSVEVTEKLRVGEETERKITATRMEYLPVATRASLMYFLIAETNLVSNMYNTSLAVFLRLFEKAMEESEKNPVPAKRIDNILKHSTFSLFRYVTRGLFSNHKVLFMLQLALRIGLMNGQITKDQFNVLIKGGAALDITQLPRAKPFSWIPDASWLNIIQLSTIPDFHPLPELIAANENAWHQWYDSETPETAIAPDNMNGQDPSSAADSFKKLLLVRSWRLDRAIMAANLYIRAALGPEYGSVAIELETAYQETAPNIPVLFLLSLGSDPTANVDALSKKLKIPLMATSMGQGQDVYARRNIQQATQSGAWVLLQNCHLCLDFMQEVEGIMTTLKDAHRDFRLWISTEAHEKFPIGLLQMSLKIAFEPPQGIKAGLLRSYNWITEEMLGVIEKKEWKPLLYTMCFLHTTVQERRKFGPLGWNIPYEFNQSDLSASIQFLQTHLYQMDPKKGINWPTVRYMICEVHYGGRITDDYDRLLMKTYGNLWLNEDIFDDKWAFGFPTSPCPEYVIPRVAHQPEYLQYLETGLPQYDKPEAFGMHANANLTFSNNQAKEIFDTILNIQPKESSGSGETPEDVVLRMADDLLKKLPEDFNLGRVRQLIDAMGGLRVPLNIFLKQEVDRMQKVLSVIRRTCKDLQLAIAGTIIMSQALQNALRSLFDARVPAEWLKVSWPSPTLGFWFSDVLARNQQYASWLSAGRPKVYWLTGFFNPQGFLTAMRQEITRAHQWALDSVSLTTEVTRFAREEVKTQPEEGVYIYGLFLDGASWNPSAKCLVDSPPKVLFSNVPVVHVSATNSAKAKGDGVYVCPCYKTPRRTGLNYIFDIDMPTRERSDKWIIRGVALLCSKQ
eukprot:GAFH01000693.1.p1 GENE.GAFH01000693.1~~GAFH01000693.1.p1  ORF type:complete len:4356 (-),score=2006.36 GAFH01000693.1:5-11701(-)